MTFHQTSKNEPYATPTDMSTGFDSDYSTDPRQTRPLAQQPVDRDPSLAL